MEYSVYDYKDNQTKTFDSPSDAIKLLNEFDDVSSVEVELYSNGRFLGAVTAIEFYEHYG